MVGVAKSTTSPNHMKNSTPKPPPDCPQHRPPTKQSPATVSTRHQWRYDLKSASFTDWEINLLCSWLETTCCQHASRRARNTVTANQPVLAYNWTGVWVVVTGRTHGGNRLVFCTERLCQQGGTATTRGCYPFWPTSGTTWCLSRNLRLRGLRNLHQQCILI